MLDIISHEGNASQKVQWDATSYPLGWLKSKSQITTNVDKDVEKLEPSYFASGNVKQCKCTGK